MAMESGMLLNGRYKTGKKLGENALGETFDAVDSQTGAKVVVKQIKDAYVAHTYEAIKACGKLDGIVAILDVFNEGGSYYAVMEFVSGMTLESYLERSNAKFPVNRVKTLLKPVISSLIRLSGEGINHGNISADNFIFTSQGDLKLIGFGHISGVVSPKSRPYAALEMYENAAKASEASDVYSVSTFIYRCITGVVPQEAARRKENDTCVRPTALGVEMSQNEESALLMGMQVDVNRRMVKFVAFERAFLGAGNQAQAKAAAPTPVQKTAPTPTPIQRTAPTPPPAPAPRPTPVSTESNSNSAGNKKKQGNTLLIVLIVVGIILVGVLGFVTYKVMTGDGESSYENSSEEAESEDGSESESGEESDTNGIEGLMEAGQYEDAISALVDNEIGAEDGSAILQEAIDNLYSQCVNETNALVDAGNFDAAYETIDNRTQYFADLRTKLDYVDNTYDQELSNLRGSIESKIVDYYSSAATKAASMDDEEKMLEAFSQLEGRMGETELSNKKEADYTTLVLAHRGTMATSGASAKEIRDYLDSNLANTGNNCRVMEFWDYYDNQYYVTKNDNRMNVSDVRGGAGYVIDNSDTYELTADDLKNGNYSEYELYFALYEIYARHGRIFADAAVSEHFNATNWYNPSISPEAFDETTLSDVEKKNVATILQYCRDAGHRD
jgi:serine/threonine protein kinase